MEPRTRPSALVIVTGLALLLGGVPSTAGAQQFSLPEHTETRIRLQALVTGPLSTVAVTETSTHRQRFTPHRVQFSHEEQGDFHYLIFANETRGRFELPTRGSWVIRRHRETGITEQIKIFLSDDERFFVRLAPDDSGRPITRMEVTLVDDVVYRDVVIPIPMERVLVTAFADIQRATEAIVDWGLFRPPTDRTAHQTMERMVGRIRAWLADREDGDPSAVDRLLVETGFDEEDSRSDGRLTDVSSVRFATVVPHVGLPIEDLRRSLYLLAQEHPGSFYLGSINTRLRSNESRVAARTSTQHHHRLVILFPYFDPRGRFQTVVIDENSEISVESLRNRYAGDAIHLIRARAHDELFGADVLHHALLNQVLLNNEWR